MKSHSSKTIKLNNMYFIGCFIVFVIAVLVIHTKGNLTVRDILISLLGIIFSWITLIICLLALLVIIGVLISEFWNTPIWKAKKKSKLSKALDDLLN